MGCLNRPRVDKKDFPIIDCFGKVNVNRFVLILKDR